jgi:acyl dehydratase
MLNSNISLQDFLNCAGTELGPSKWQIIDQARIDRFADATNDHQFIHVDPQKAAATPFGSTIAHGFLTLSLLSHLLGEIMPIPEGTVMGINYGSDKVRFLQPVTVNSRIRALARIESVEEKQRGQYLQKTAVSIEIENQTRPAMVAQILSLYVIRRPK